MALRGESEVGPLVSLLVQAGAEVLEVRRGKASAYYWHFETADQRQVKFSVRFFGRSSLRTLAEEVISRSRGAEVDEVISNMAEGVFPWRIFW